MIHLQEQHIPCAKAGVRTLSTKYASSIRGFSGQRASTRSGIAIYVPVGMSSQAWGTPHDCKKRNSKCIHVRSRRFSGDKPA
jgi:hypothetical protein